MRQCLLPYFDKDQFSGDVRLNKSSFENMSELKESVEMMLEGDLPFRVKTDESDSEYGDSIDDLIQTLYSKIGEMELKFDFNAVAKRDLSRFVKSLTMPKPLTKTEQLIQANIAGSDLITEDERRNIRFSSLVRSIYGKGASPLNATRQSAFDDTMLLRSIINTSEKELVTNEKELNEGIITTQSEEYDIIKDYLLSQGYNLSDYGIPQNLYHTDSKSKTQALTKGYYNILTLMYNIIEKARTNGTLEQELEDGWNKYILNDTNPSLYRAVNAYVNLTYFDDVLRQSFGEYIQIDEEQDAPITKDSNGYKQNGFSYKYTFAKGNKFATKTWGVEDHDSLKEMSKFSQILIQSIPVYEYNIERAAESESFGKMEVKDFVNTISKLLDLSSAITDQTIQDAICLFQSNPRQSIQTIFSRIFGNNNKTLLKNLFDLGFDQNYINYLYSIYRTCFKGTSSWDAIEQRYIRNNGLPGTYPIMNTVFGIMNSNVANNFLQTTFNYDKQKTETTVKKKYNDRSTKFDVINNVNALTIDRQNKQELLDTYNLSKSGRNYTVTISVQGVPTSFEFTPTNNTGILDKTSTSSKLLISNMPSLSDIDLGSLNERRKLVGGIGLSEDEAKLMSMLRFIDTMLSTNFSTDQEGLRKLGIMQNLSSINLKELFASAARALVVTDIYNQFETATKDDGTKYSKLELLQFLNDKSPYYDAIQAFNTSQRKPYFISRYDGVQLSTLYSNQNWLDDLSQVEAILSGETSKSVISNLEGSKIPNFSPQFLGARLEQQLMQSKLADNATSSLLFVRYRNAVKAKVINTDVLTKDGIRKQIKDMTSGELLYDSIVNKFFTPILSEKSVYTQPTTYSDKTKFLLYGVSLETLGITSLLGQSFDERIESMLVDSIGEMYRGVWNNVVNDYKTLFSEYVTDGVVDLHSVQDWLNAHSAKDLQDRINEYNRVNGTNLVLYKDTHYREIALNGKKKRLSINELLYDQAFNVYVPGRIHTRLQQEKLSFLNDLLSNRVSFPVQRDPESPSKLLSKAESDSTTGFLVQLLGAKATDWVQGSNMILAKARNTKTGKTRNVLYGNIENDEEIILNPALNAYFMLDNLIGNNLRMSLTGSEINHKVKALAGFNLDLQGIGFHKELIRTLNPRYSGNQTTFFDVQMALKNYDLLMEARQLLQQLNDSDQEVVEAVNIALDQLTRDLPIPLTTQVDPNEVEILRSIYSKQIYKIENAAQNAQFKRNVIIPGTMRPYTPGCIDGIGHQVKVAVVNDVGADVFNFDGKADGIDAHDGSAMESPITSILENKSLQDSEVGTIKKPIHHWYDDRYGTATLLKYAVDTITNQWMRQSEGNDLNGTKHAIQLRNLFKKMHHIRWNNAEALARGERGIDLIDGCDYRAREVGNDDFHSINFFEDILEGHELFYKKGGQDFQITDFGRENGVYFTEEQEVEPTGYGTGAKFKVYHYFDEEGNHFPSLTLIQNPELHTIDSLFELHTALGGIYSESKNSEGMLQYSEASNNAVANFVNKVAYKRDPEQSPKVSVDQTNYYQPLKEMLIDIVANNSAVKNGAGNLNQASAYYDNSKLSYMVIGTSQYGIQMDADHTADEGKMTEFSQVISSLDAGGRLHDYVSQIYQTLGEVATQLSQIELDAVESFRNGEGKSKMYDIIGRTIINNLAGNRGEAGLAESIIENIKKGFNLNTDHGLDEVKIPFSDPNIYSKILSTFVSIINKKSIKRQYPGQGTVMVPGYDLSMIYDLDGKTYQFEDLLNMAVAAGYTSSAADISQYNKDVVRQFLQGKQQEQSTHLNTDSFQPTDNVLISFDTVSDVENMNTGEVGQMPVPGVYHASLKSIEDYYLFKENVAAYLESKGITGATNISMQKDITVPRNLAPARISWTITSPEGQKEMNIFDHWRVKGLFQELNRIDGLKGISKEEKKKRSLEARKNFNPQQAFDELDRGLYVDQDGTEYAISNLVNKPAELIMSNLYKTKFGIGEGDSLAKVKDAGQGYFMSHANLISSDNYDLAFTKQSGKHLYVTFKPIQENTESFDAHYKNWANTILRDYVYPEGTNPEDRRIIHRVYATTRDNLELFEIGREVLRDDLLWDSSKKKFTDKNGKVLKNQQKYRRYGEDKVLEYIEFLSQYNVQEEVDGKVSRYVVYNVNRSALKSTFDKPQYDEKALSRQDKEGNTYAITADQKFDEEVNDFISRKLLAKIYESSDFNGVQLNSKVTPESHTVIKNCLYRFGNALRYDPELSSYLSKDLLEKVQKAGMGQDGLIEYKKLNSITSKYRAAIAKKKYASFLRSQSFTASRIPAQTLQSFMQMSCVGFTGLVNNQCFVSHWQTWLQGSDYDIDKAYIMGLSFDGNGRYVGWSNLFDYSSEETIKASENLPMPRKIQYSISQDGVNIDQYIDQIESSQDTPELKINAYANLLNYLYKNNISSVSYTNPYGQEVMRQLGLHEFTEIPANLKEDASKNFISSHIQNTVQNLRNMVGAYSPIEMEDFRAASNNSPKGEQSSKMTLLNPTTKLLMQIQNITGKNVIGIAANGEKGSFMWHYYINDVLRNPTPDKLSYVKFEFNTNRIQGRAKGDPLPQTVNTLPDVNFEGVNPQIIQDWNPIRLTGNITVDLMISQVLSAATDNAKELILAKVNAGNKLAKMYLFLITLGFDINDIVKFMTSPAINFIDAITETNIFTGQKISMKDAIAIARGDYSSLVVGEARRAILSKNKDLIEILESGDIENFKNPFKQSDYSYNDVEDLITLIGSIKHLQGYDIHSADIQADINEFENVMEGADEFSALGQALGINQGIPTSKIDLIKRISRFNKLYSKRFSEVGAAQPDPLDFRRFLVDQEYAREVKESYNKVKKCVNIFDLIDHIPQFKAIFNIFSAVCDVDHNLAIKTQIYDYAYDRLSATNPYISETYQNNLLRGTDNVFISMFLNEQDVGIPYTKGVTLLEENRQAYKANDGGLLRLDSPGNIASFKSIFENQIIPDLKRGIIHDYRGGRIVEIDASDLMRNPFVKSLIRGFDKDVPLYKCDLNMMTIENSNDSKIKFQSYLKGLKELRNIELNGVALSDLFVLYNLIVNKNQYGSDRLTTLFDSFLQTSEQLSLIKKYLKYIGDLDYSGKVKGEGDVITITHDGKQTQILMSDLKRLAAPIVRSLSGQSDPTVIINEESGPTLYEKVERDYMQIGSLIPDVMGESLDQKLERIYNDTAYFTLGGSYKILVDKLVQNVRQINDNTLSAIRDLQKRGILTIQKLCE